MTDQLNRNQSMLLPGESPALHDSQDTVEADAARTFVSDSGASLGRTASTKFEPNTSTRFVFWIAREDGDPAAGRLEIGNIVAAVSDDESDITFGTVVEMRSYSDVDSFIADYLSHDFGNADLQVPTDVAEIVVVTCDVMRNLSNTARPVGRSRVFFPSSLGIQFAYGLVDREGNSIFAGAALPIGIFENGDGTTAAVSVDEDFVIGPEGAHLNVSGISGLASKTSAIQFAVKSMFTHTSKRVGVVFFNVKSRDLLYVDQPNPRAREDPWSVGVYEKLGIPIEPFMQARYFAPRDPRNPGATQSLRRKAIEPFSWDLPMIADDIPQLFNPLDWDDKLEGAWLRVRDEIEQTPLHSYGQMLAWISKLIQYADNGNRQWSQGTHIQTWRKLQARLGRFPQLYQGLIDVRGKGQDVPWQELTRDSLFVVDMEMLGDRGKRLVFGRAVRKLGDMMEQEGGELDAVVIFVDELNKFAPAGNIRSPLKSRLVDITARGRSIGLVLFGAEQFSSSVENQIIENSSTFLYGRTESNELRAPAYAALSNEVKAKLTMLTQGRLLARFAKFPQPIFLRFPYPPCLPGDQFEAPDG